MIVFDKYLISLISVSRDTYMCVNIVRWNTRNTVNNRMRKNKYSQTELHPDAKPAEPSRPRRSCRLCLFAVVRRFQCQCNERSDNEKYG